MATRSIPPKSIDTPKAKKERIIALLTKVNDRDTQRRATEELHELIYVSLPEKNIHACLPAASSLTHSSTFVRQDKAWMDSEALFMLVHQLCIPTPVQKGFARKVILLGLH